MLSGEIKSVDDIPEGDIRRSLPRFSKENFPKNLELVDQLAKIAKESGNTPAQLAIGWVRHLSKKDDNPAIIPIPGATTESRIFENAEDVKLSSEDIEKIDSALKSFKVVGTRYP